MGLSTYLRPREAEQSSRDVAHLDETWTIGELVSLSCESDEEEERQNANGKRWDVEDSEHAASSNAR